MNTIRSVMIFKTILISSFIFSFFSACAQQQKNDLSIKKIKIEYDFEVVVPNIEIPWGFTFLPDESILITEKSGKLIHFKGDKVMVIKNVPEVYLRGHGGLLDIKLHPNYKKNGWIYMTYSSSKKNDRGGNTTLSRAKLLEGSLTNLEVLYKAEPNTTGSYHFGSRIEFDNNGFVYFSVGDRGDRDENPQDITKDCGKIYRLHDDGRIPKDNPFTHKKEAKKAIYSYGHRNPQGMVIHPVTGKIWTHEHGPQGGDEINIIKKGANYGWPIITYGLNYGGSKITDETERIGMEQPIYYWVPSIAPSGMEFVSSSLYPNLKGKLLVGSLKYQYLEVLTLNDDDEVIHRDKLFEGIGRLRSVNQGLDGYIYIGVENYGVLRVLPKK